MLSALIISSGGIIVSLLSFKCAGRKSYRGFLTKCIVWLCIWCGVECAVCSVYGLRLQPKWNRMPPLIFQKYDGLCAQFQSIYCRYRISFFGSMPTLEDHKVNNLLRANHFNFGCYRYDEWQKPMRHLRQMNTPRANKPSQSASQPASQHLYINQLIEENWKKHTQHNNNNKTIDEER